MTTKTITSWSYSALKNYKSCPRKVKLSRIDKIKEPGSPAMERGTAIHLLAETFIKEKQKRMPEELLKFEKLIKRLASKGAVCEEEWAFRKDWTPCGWFDADCWLRAKLDARLEVGTTMEIYDWKTGKTYEDNKAQCSFYAMLTFILYPWIKKVKTTLCYLDSGDEQTDTYTSDELTDMIAAWEEEARPMLSDTIFAPRPSYLCKYCFYSKAKNNNCEF